jgi:hypothetical protein
MLKYQYPIGNKEGLSDAYFIIDGEASVINIDPNHKSVDVESLLSFINRAHLLQDDLQNNNTEKRKLMSYDIK